MIEDKIRKYFLRKQSEDLKHLPSFEELIEQSAPFRGYLYYLKIAASILLLIALGYWLISPEKKDAIATNNISYTNNLITQPEYVWNWQSPTQSLLEYSKK